MMRAQMSDSLSNYKLKDSIGPPEKANTLWKFSPGFSPTLAYVPIANAYQFVRCHAQEEKTLKDELTYWKLECFDFLLLNGWKQSYLLRIPVTADLLTLTPVESEISDVLLIEKRFVDEVPLELVENKFKIPVVRCQLVQRSISSPLLPPERRSSETQAWCKFHHGWCQNDELFCGAAIPFEYLPCDMESDQGGTYCPTHGVWADSLSEYRGFCETYKGPLEEVIDPLYNGASCTHVWDHGCPQCVNAQKIKQIPPSYVSCNFFKDTCYQHEEGRRVTARYCDKYDGPWKMFYV